MSMTFTEILTESRRLVGDTTTKYSTADITVSANRALDRAVGLIRQSEGRWQWDDSNNTDLPIATTGLVTDQQDYSLDATHYRIERIEVKDTSGNWTKVQPIDKADLFDTSITDFLSGGGTPTYYDKVGNSIFLYPTPSYTQTASLKVFYERGPSYFTTSDTTKAPGINALFHRLIPLWCAYDYAFINQMEIKKDLEKEIFKIESELQEYYGHRDRDEKIGLTVKSRKFNFK